MTAPSLKDRIVAMIRASGPISIAAYMDLCLHDRTHGYYATRPGIGEDFITAPEISQIFGELIGLWAAHGWQQLGAPDPFRLVEIGPGRGTLMADALRAAASVEGFQRACQLCLVEPSPVLRTQLSTRFEAHAPQFFDSLDDVPADQPVILIANEWLDCLPVQQFIRVGEVWHERVIGVDDAGALVMGLNSQALPPEIVLAEDTDAVEIQPGLKTLSETLSALFAQTPGRALLIDYGPPDATPADTLRSYKAGTQIDPLAAPGASDLTCDVDFSRLVRLLKAQGLAVLGPTSQSAFLLSLGAEARLNQLARQHPGQADALYQHVRRLVDPADMGTRFQTVRIATAE
ncbi:MAG: SAM-dependent methyltransferase [Pseudomonadota bacterium]